MDRTVLSELDETTDFCVRVSVVDVDGLTLVEVRHYVPSRDEYGRGDVYPVHLAEKLSFALEEVVSDLYSKGVS